MLKLNKIFFTNNDDVFYQRILPSQDQKNFLVNCKNEIRDYLRPRISKATTKILGMEKAVEPRFRTQGSWSYKTCVQPAHILHQEMDWDFGVYLPVHVWEENGPPHAMAKAYFDLVEGLLLDLCKAKGWHLNGDKDTCIRVHVCKWAHIDIPLYAAPEEKFIEVIEKSLVLESMGHLVSAADSANDFEEPGVEEPFQQQWDDLDEIVLATRTGEWKPSDPEAVLRWFNDRIAEYGQQFRRVNRYIKAWRDYHWKEGGGPSSVAIMIAIGQTFEKQLGRDELALEKAVTHLAQLIKGEIRETAIDNGSVDFNTLDDTGRIAVSNKASELASALFRSRSYAISMADQAMVDLQNQFGSRIPNRRDLVSVDGGHETVRSIPADRVPAPLVKATSAG